MPVPPALAVMISQVALLTAVQLQPLGVVTPTLPVPPLAGKDWLVGEIAVGFDAVVVAVAELLVGLGSEEVELTVAMLLIVAPLVTEQLTWVTKVMVADAPGINEEKVTVRLLPEPPQTPPPAALHETKVTADGRLSVTVTEDAVFGPLLVAVIVYVSGEPATDGFGEAT